MLLYRMATVLLLWEDLPQENSTPIFNSPSWQLSSFINVKLGCAWNVFPLYFFQFCSLHVSLVMLDPLGPFGRYLS